jgi:hypothetical protein
MVRERKEVNEGMQAGRKEGRDEGRDEKGTRR